MLGPDGRKVKHAFIFHPSPSSSANPFILMKYNFQNPAILSNICIKITHVAGWVMKREKQEQLQQVWNQLHVDISLLQMQIKTLKETIGQQDYSSLKFTETAAGVSNRLCGLLNDVYNADAKHGKSLLDLMKNALQLQNELTNSIKSIRNYGESLRSESVNLLQINTRVDMLMSCLKETRSKIAKPSALEKLGTFAKSVSAEKGKRAYKENAALEHETPKRARNK